MSTPTKQNDNSEDEFESADEGESTQTPTIKSNTSSSDNKNPLEIKSLPAVTDGWGNWNIDDELSVKTRNPNIFQQDSTSSLSSSPSKTGGNLSQNESDEDNQTEISDQQRLQSKKKFRKKQIETNLLKEENKMNTRISRRNDESSSTIVTKHKVKDAHHVLDRLAAQSPTRTVITLLILKFDF